MAIREIPTYELSRLEVGGVALPIYSLPPQRKRLLDRAFQDLAKGQQGKFSLTIDPGQKEIARTVRYARRVGWLTPQALDLSGAEAVLKAESALQTRFLPGLGLVGQGLTSAGVSSLPMTIFWAGWGIVGFFNYAIQGIRTWRAHRKAQDHADREGAQRAKVDVATGGLYAAASVETVVETLKSALHIAARVAMQLASAANGLFGGGLVISLINIFRSLYNYSQFRSKLRGYLENRNLSEAQQVEGALRYLLESVSGDHARAKVMWLKRRTSWSFVQDLVSQGQLLLNDPKRLKEARSLVGRALQENRRKNGMQIASAAFSILAGTGYLMGTAMTGGILPLALGMAGVGAMMLMSAAVRARDLYRWLHKSARPVVSP